MKYKYPVYQPSLKGNEKKYVQECLDSTWISSKGKFIKEFEKKFSDYLGIKYSATVSNGTVALHTALLALDIGPGDEVIVPTFTYIASVNAIYYTGATPVFVDSEMNYWQMDTEDVKGKITSKTKAIMAVHLYGQMCDMNGLINICKANNLFLVEDCAEAFGSKYYKNYAGTFGDVSTFSFFGNKTITTGEGGMVCCNSEQLYEKIVKIKGQGLAKGKEYFHDIIGYNYRMTNICAAIGCAQLENAKSIIKKKRQIAEWYNNRLMKLPLSVPKERPDTVNTYWMYTILLNDYSKRDDFRTYLKERGIETRPGFHPVHSMPMYFKAEYKFPIADKLGQHAVNLPSYPDLCEEDVHTICREIKRFFDEN